MSSSTTHHCDGHDHTPHKHEPRSDAVMASAARIGAALGDVSRLRLLELLCDGRHCVSELAAEMGDSMSSISHRLRVLYEARLVTRTRDGKHVYYALADAHVEEILLQLFGHAAE